MDPKRMRQKYSRGQGFLGAGGGPGDSGHEVFTSTECPVSWRPEQDRRGGVGVGGCRNVPDSGQTGRERQRQRGRDGDRGRDGEGERERDRGRDRDRRRKTERERERQRERRGRHRQRERQGEGGAGRPQAGQREEGRVPSCGQVHPLLLPGPLFSSSRLALTGAQQPCALRAFLLSLSINPLELAVLLLRGRGPHAAPSAPGRHPASVSSPAPACQDCGEPEP